MELNYLKFYRLQNGFSMKELAEKADISTSKYLMIEQGDQTASSEVANKIAEILKVSPNHLFFAVKFTIREMEGDVLNAEADFNS
jgi:transcriptional regulator with XRE-family HTH domain